MADLYLLEPEVAPDWKPFQESRPTAELRAGAWLIRERWEAIADGETRAIMAPEHLSSFSEDGSPSIRRPGPVEGPCLVGRSDFAPSGMPVDLAGEPQRLVNDQQDVGWWVPEGMQLDPGNLPGQWEETPIEGVLLHGSFDIVTALEHLLVADVADFVHEQGDPLPDGSLVIGDPAEVVILGAAVEPGVVFDVRSGAIVLEQGAYVRSGTRLEGPIYVGAGTTILGGEIRHSVFGPRCKVRGEISHSVFLGLANKAHDGFVGHSVVGTWVNLGAGTTTSNLKNTYGVIRLQLGDRAIPTGRQFLGTLFGDHVKIAIGTMLSTGTVVGTGANVFGARPPRFVPPFAWGSDGIETELEGFLRTAQRVMGRREVPFTDEVRDYLTAIYGAAIG